MSATALRPPVRVALARPVPTLPDSGAYEPKFDGHRLLIFRTENTEDPVLIQSRSGRIVTGTFPDLAAAARDLPAGTVLDGEAVVWTNAGRTDFSALQRRALTTPARAAELARTLPASYAAFDLLAIGERDLRRLPYIERRAGLVALLDPLGPPLQPVPMTTDPALAATWYETLPAAGIEGLVIKRPDQPYRGGRRDWRKLRHTDTRDAAVIGTVGPPTRPEALAVVLPDDDTPVISEPLAPVARSQLAAALRGQPSPGSGSATAFTDDGTAYRPVPPGLVVEVRQGTTRQHVETTVVRLRPPA